MEASHDLKSYHQVFLLHLLSHLVPLEDIEKFINHQKNIQIRSKSTGNNVCDDDDGCFLIWRSKASWNSNGLNDDISQEVIFIDANFYINKYGVIELCLGVLLFEGKYLQKEFNNDQLSRYAKENNLILGPNDTPAKAMAEYMVKSLSSTKTPIAHVLRSENKELTVKLHGGEDEDSRNGAEIMKIGYDEIDHDDCYMGRSCLQMMRRLEKTSSGNIHQPQNQIKAITKVQDFSRSLIGEGHCKLNSITPKEIDQIENFDESYQTHSKRNHEDSEEPRKAIKISLIQVNKVTRKINKRRGKIKFGETM